MGSGVPDHRGLAAGTHPTPASDPHHSSAPQPPPTADPGSLAASLCPALRAECGGRLSPVQWFRSAWGAGGASTGTAEYRLSPTKTVEVVVKLPVGPREHAWTVGAGRCDPEAEHDGPTPRVLASGTELGGYDLAWLVVEKLGGNPVSASLSAGAVEGLLRATAEWYALAAELRDASEAEGRSKEDWAALVARGREAVKDNDLPEGQRWNEALRQVGRILPRLVAAWEARAINTWCHGDLHPGNAMRRKIGADGHQNGGGERCVLIDLALVHPGHWVEDALYLERLYWAKPELLFGVRPVTALAKFRRDMGLEARDDYGTLAQVRRALMAATVPAFLEHEGHPRYVHAALETLERTIPLVPH